MRSDDPNAPGKLTRLPQCESQMEKLNGRICQLREAIDRLYDRLENVISISTPIPDEKVEGRPKLVALASRLSEFNDLTSIEIHRIEDLISSIEL